MPQTLRVLKFVREAVQQLKSHIDHHTLLETLIPPLLPIDRSSRQKLNREILELTDVINQMKITDICDHFIQTHSHRVCLNRYKKIEITPCNLSDHQGLKTRYQQQQQVKHLQIHVN